MAGDGKKVVELLAAGVNVNGVGKVGTFQISNS
jgi:hypothetical protein